MRTSEYPAGTTGSRHSPSPRGGRCADATLQVRRDGSGASYRHPHSPHGSFGPYRYSSSVVVIPPATLWPSPPRPVQPQSGPCGLSDASRLFVTGRYWGSGPSRTQVQSPLPRQRGISAAYAAGLPLELTMRLSNHSDNKFVFRHYLDPQTPASDEGRLFLGGFWCPVFRLDRFCLVAPSVTNMRQPVVQSQASRLHAYLVRQHTCSPLFQKIGKLRTLPSRRCVVHCGGGRLDPLQAGHARSGRVGGFEIPPVRNRDGAGRYAQ